MNTDSNNTDSNNTASKSTLQDSSTRQDDFDRQDDLPVESAEALIASMKSIVLAETGLHIQVEREMIPIRNEDCQNLSMFVVTMPEEATPEQRTEADYWLREIGPLFRYAQDKAYYA